MYSESVSLVKLLCGKQLLSASNIVDAGVQIIHETRDRFVTSKVSIHNKAVYFVKHARDTENVEALEKECLLYKYFGEHNLLKSLVPKFILEDTQTSVLIVQWTNGINSFYSSIPRDEVLVLIAKALAKLHINTCKVKSVVNDSKKTWIISNLSKEEEWNKFLQLSNNITEVEKKIIIDGMKHAHDKWKSDAIIHGDLKWEHFIISDNNGDSSLKLIDWELATYGDSAWDVACVLSDIIFDQHYVKEEDIDTVYEILASGNINIFLKSYCQACTCNDDFLERVSIFCATRLFQTSLELVSVYGWENQASKVKLLISMSIDIFEHLNVVLNIIKQKSAV